MNSTYHRLFICPEWISQAVMGRADPAEKLFDVTYMTNRFNMHDLAFCQALQGHPAVARLFGEYASSFGMADNETEAIQSVRAWSISQSEVLRKEIEDSLLQDPVPGEGALYRIYYTTGTTVLAIAPGFLKACENDHYLYSVFTEINRHALQSESLPSLLKFSPLMDRFLKMAAVLNQNLPPKPVFV